MPPRMSASGGKADIQRALSGFRSLNVCFRGESGRSALGSQIALPPDTSLLADLASTKFTTGTVSGKLVIQAERKEDVVARLGRSPDRGDAVVMAFTRGQDNAGRHATDPNLERPRVNRGHENKRPR